MARGEQKHLAYLFNQNHATFLCLHDPIVDLHHHVVCAHVGSSQRLHTTTDPRRGLDDWLGGACAEPPNHKTPLHFMATRDGEDRTR
jgi:hypothetical protein